MIALSLAGLLFGAAVGSAYAGLYYMDRHRWVKTAILLTLASLCSGAGTIVVLAAAYRGWLPPWLQAYRSGGMYGGKPE
jgi:hypothetical protein